MKKGRGKTLTISQVANRINKGVSTVYRMKDEKKIPFFRGGLVQGLYTYELYVDKFIQSREGDFYA